LSNHAEKPRGSFKGQISKRNINHQSPAKIEKCKNKKTPRQVRERQSPESSHEMEYTSSFAKYTPK
jgi:hypothetical protein